jgi:hypothetical protein
MLKGLWNPRVRIALLLAGMFAASACGGGSCSSCSCMTSIPGGFPLDKRIPGAVQARVSQQGLEFFGNKGTDLVDCFMSGGLDFCVSGTSSNIVVADVDICSGSTGNRNASGICEPNGNCDIHIEVKDIALTPQANQDQLHAEIRLLVYNTAKNGHPASNLPIGIDWVVGGTTNCNVVLDTERSGAATMRAQANVKFTTDATTGYTKVAFTNVSVDQIDDNDIEMGGCWAATVLNWFRGTIIDQMTGSLLDTVQDTLNTQLCQQCATEEDCPNGTACVGGICKFGDGTCLQSLGTEGRIDVGSQLASVSPGLQAYLDILARAGGGDWNGQMTDNNGLNLGLFGGARSPTHNECVPLVTPPANDAVPPAGVFTGGTPGPVPFHVGIGVHDSFLNHAAFAAWDGGVLCLDVGSETSEMLNAGTFSILVRSLGDLTHGENVPIKMSIRPQNPPTITLGAGTFNADGTILDPLMKVSMPDFAIELMAFVDERFVRVLTIHTDVVLPLSMRMNQQSQLEIVIGDVKEAFTNVTITDSGMLSDDPAEIAAALPDVLGVALPFLASAFPAIDVPTVPCTGDPSKALLLTIPEGGITSVENQRFLGIFANLAFGPAARRFRATATAEVTAVEVPPTAAFALGRSFDARRAPSATLRLGGFGADGSARDLEWSYRLDGGFWSPYVTTPEVRLSGGPLWLQGRHRVDVKARLRGDAASESDLVSREIVIDSVAPTLAFARDGQGIRLVGSDQVTPADLLEYSWRAPGGDFSSWSRTARVPDARAGLQGRVRDEAGNVTVATLATLPAAAPTDPADDRAAAQAGCAAGGGAGSALLGLLAVAGLALLTWRRRGGALLAALLLCATAAAPGCNCGGSTSGFEDAGPDPDPVYTPGPIGRHASLAAAPDGTLYVSAYEEKYGDLVVGAVGTAPDYDIRWELVDGIPTDSRVKGDPNGWRYGIKESGDNVGLYSSLIVGADGLLRVAYHEATAESHGDPAKLQLKYAVRSGEAGTCERSIDCWQTHVVDANGLAGYYANLTWSAEGVPTIAYMAPARLDAESGQVFAELRFAVATSATPTQTTDWTITVVDSIAVSCAGLCGADQVCRADTNVCAAPTSDCASECGADQACIGGACVATAAASQLADLPMGLGLWVKTVRDSFGRPVLVYYDRVNGDLKRAMVVGASTWSVKALDTEGDVGQFPAALIDAADNLHVAYADASRGRLLYLKTTLADAATPTKEVIDSGAQATGGRNLVGAETQIALDASAQLHVLYQDQRLTDLLHATKASGATTWAVAPLRQDDKAGYGFFTRLCTTASGTYFIDYRYDRLDTPTSEITQAEEAVRARAHSLGTHGNTFGWLEVGSL